MFRDAGHGALGPNATSLSIYSGPTQSEDVAIDRSPSALRNSKAGWLATGDAELAVEDRYDRLFERYFGREASAGIDVGTLAAPHHGSWENWNPRLLLDARPEVVVVSVGQRDGWNLPCDDVREDCECRGVDVHECTRLSRSTLEECVLLL